MSEHYATIKWERETEKFDYASYNRNHLWEFESGIKVDASAAPRFLGQADRVDPEEAFVAAISSCHMLTFLAICARKRIVVERYEDRAVGLLAENEQGKLAITQVKLTPRIIFGVNPPGTEMVRKIHRLSHDECFIANSVTTEILVVS